MKALIYRGPRDIAFETMKYPELHDDAFVAANLERWRN